MLNLIQLILLTNIISSGSIIYVESNNTNTCNKEIKDSLLVQQLLKQAAQLESMGNFKNAMILLDSAEHIMGSINTREDSVLTSQLYHQRGNNQYRLRIYESALSFYEKAKVFREHLYGSQHILVADTRFMLGNLYHDLRNYKNSKEEYLFAKDIYLAHKDSIKYSSCLLSFGNIKFNQDSLEIARTYYLSALNFLDTTNEKHFTNVARAYYMFSQCEILLDNLSNASYNINKANRFANQMSNPSMQLLALIQNGRTLIEKNKGNYELASMHSDEALSIYTKIYGTNSAALVPIMLNNAALKFIRGELTNAEDIFLKAIGLCSTSSLKEDILNCAKCLGNLSSLYSESGNYEKAIVFLNRSNEQIIKAGDQGSILEAITFLNMGIHLKNINKYDDAHQAIEKAKEILTQRDAAKSFNMAKAYENIANIMVEKRDFKNALMNQLTAINILSEIVGKSNHVEVGKAYYKLATIYEKTHDYNAALNNYNRALEIIESNFGGQHSFYAYMLGGKISILSLLDSFEIAAKLSHLALNNLNYIGDSPHELLKVNRITYLIELLSRKAILYRRWYEKTNNPEYHSIACKAIKSAINAYEWQRRTFNSNNEKIFFQDRYNRLYEEALLTFIANKNLNDLSAVFDIFENRRAQVYSEIHQKNQNLNSGNIDSPEQIIEKLKIELVSVEVGRFELSNKIPKKSFSEIDYLNSRYFELYRELEKAESKSQSIMTKNILSSNITIADLQSSLQADQSVLHYFVGDSSIYSLVIDRNECSMKEIKRDFNLNQLVNNFVGGLTLRSKDTLSSVINNGFINYKQSALKLYEILIKPIQEKLKQNIIIIPDRELNYIPFEALITDQNTENVKHSDLDYWIKHKTISYALSARHYYYCIKSQIQKMSKVNGCLAMAPFAKNVDGKFDVTRLNFDDLQYSLKEVKNAVSIIGSGKAVIDSFASSVFLFANANQYNVILLSTHGKANSNSGDFSYIAFSDRLVYGKEIYHLNLKAELVLLSACETGLGEMHPGEGLVGMNYAFAAAGAINVCSTLWQVNDKTTSDLTGHFLKSIYGISSTVISKSNALRNAKLKLLNKETTSHPYFWASMIGYGSMQ